MARIIETNIQFRTLVPRNATKRIVLHHSASGSHTTWQNIQDWHLKNGWAGIGYHYVIHADGGIYRGRPEDKAGAHAYQDAKHEANSDGIGICLVGNFMLTQPTTPQLDSLVELVRDIWTRYPDIPVVGHREVMATSCPGDRFPWAELRLRLEVGKKVAEQWKLDIIERAKKAGLITEDHDPDEVATKWFVLAVLLNYLGK